MSLLKSFEFIPGVKWFETEMHDSLFQHSVFGAIVFLIVSHTDVYKFVGQLIQVKDKNVLMLVHAVVFAVIMYFGSMYLFAPLLTEGLDVRPHRVGGVALDERVAATIDAQAAQPWTVGIDPAIYGKKEDQ